MPLMTHPLPPEGKGSPPWVIATLFPNQGDWSECEYLELNRGTNRLIELSDGFVEVLDVPTKKHQLIVQFLYRALFAFISPLNLGQVLVAPYPLRLRQEKMREPDLLFARAEHVGWFGENVASAADMVIEVLSEDGARDLEKKRLEYQEAGIPEYWIVDPRDQRVTVLVLTDGSYAARGEWVHSGRAESEILAGFGVDLTELFSGNH